MEDGSHLTLLCETRAGYRNLCRLITAAHAGTRPEGREPTRCRPSPPTRRSSATPRGWCASPAALATAPWRERSRGPATPRRPRPAAAAPDLRPRPPADRAPAALRPPRPPPQPAAGRAGGAARRARGGHRQRARPQPRAHAAAGRAGGGAAGPHARRVRALAARQLLARAGPARGHGGALRRAPGGGGRVGAAGRAADLRPDQRPGLHLPRLGGPRRRRQAGRHLRPARGGALPARERRARAEARVRGGAARDPPPGPVGLLPAAPRHARAGARGGGGGARDRHGARDPSARAGARLERGLDRLLPHRPLAHRPAGQRAPPGPLPQRGPHGAAGHRPGLPARHPRGADPARARPLRPRPLGAGGGVRHLPGALGGARLRQGAWAAPGRDRAAGAHGGPVAARQRHPGRRGGGPGGPWAARRAGGRWCTSGARRGRAAAPPVPAPGRHGHLHPAADRPLPDPAGRHGGPPDGAVGQGLLRRRRLPQDRPAGPGDAVGGRALRGGDRAHAQRADRPLADRLRRPARL